MRSVAGALLACLLAAHQAAAAEPSPSSVPAPRVVASPTAVPAAAPPAGAPLAEAKPPSVPLEAATAEAVDLNFTNLQRRLAARLARPLFEIRSRFGPPAVETSGFGVLVERNCGR